MARYRIGADLEFETVTPGELEDWGKRRAQSELDLVRGTKLRRLPSLFGKASGGVLNLGGDSGGPQIGPTEGNAWVIKLLCAVGLTPSATAPDVVNFLIYGAGSAGQGGGGIPWWQLNGNQFSSGFGTGEIFLNPGEYIGLQSVGTFAATGVVGLVGNVIQCPAEKLPLLVGPRV